MATDKTKKLQVLGKFGGDGTVKSVNGNTPDENGNVEIKVVSEQVQADWNQNDPTAPDFVKNRTHYKTVAEQTIIEKQDYEFTDSNQIGVDRLTVWSFTGFTEAEKLTVGGVAVVEFDSDVYNLEIKETANFNADFGMSFGRAIGNLSLLGYGDSDTGEPFVIFNSEYFAFMAIASPSTADPEIHAVSLKMPITTFCKIDYEYLPEAANETDFGFVKSKPVTNPYGLLPVNIYNGFLYVDALRTPELYAEHNVEIPKNVGDSVNKIYGEDTSVYSALMTAKNNMHYLQYALYGNDNFVEFLIFPVYGSLKPNLSYGVSVGADCNGNLYSVRFYSTEDYEIGMTLKRIM